ncbi:hypothetical protein HanIR_Chr12g0603141 [Helianthus annuus]|nr:hypothetical protein HanIR_Chr12g0603141 [Helianthus annuus]
MFLAGLASPRLFGYVSGLCVSRTPLCFIESCLISLTYSIQVPRLYSNLSFLSPASCWCVRSFQLLTFSFFFLVCVQHSLFYFHDCR